MYYLFMYTVIFILSLTFFLRDNITIKYNKWKKINTLVSVNTKNKFLIIWYSIKLVLNLYWLSILNYLNNSVTKIDKNTYVVPYKIDGKLYKLVTKVKRGPIPILQIINNEENDVTRHVLPYLGPNYDQDISPSFFGYDTLFFEFGDGTSNLYKSTDSLKNCLITKET